MSTVRSESTAGEDRPATRDRLEGYCEGLRTACLVLARAHRPDSGPEFRESHELLLDLNRRARSVADAQPPLAEEGPVSHWSRLWARSMDAEAQARRDAQELTMLMGELLACRSLQQRLEAARERGDKVAETELLAQMDGRCDLAWAQVEDVVQARPAERLMFGRGVTVTYTVESEQGDHYSVTIPRVSRRQFAGMLAALNNTIGPCEDVQQGRALPDGSTPGYAALS